MKGSFAPCGNLAANRKASWPSGDRNSVMDGLARVCRSYALAGSND